MVGYASDALWCRAMLLSDCPKVRPKSFPHIGVQPWLAILRAEDVMNEDRAESVGHNVEIKANIVTTLDCVVNTGCAIVVHTPQPGPPGRDSV